MQDIMDAAAVGKVLAQLVHMQLLLGLLSPTL